ncbi:MAG TPA: coniferyl aldehyde dehydrogenase [Legionella sp.]|nr:coniferyl aldehyde dehydrogenase [Legionella sp.]
MDINTSFDSLKKEHQLNFYPTLDERRRVLSVLKKALQQDAKLLVAAVNKDYRHRSEEETLFLEIFPTIRSIEYCLKNTGQWMKKKRRDVSWLLAPAKAYTLPQPLGIVGNMVPWNYPVYLALVPAIYALAAGNRVLIKMSELSTQTGLALQSLIKKHHLEQFIQVINGDVEVAQKFAALPFGHLIFTGSTKVGKMVMKAASEQLTPVTLELGGKSPAILSSSMNSQYFNRLFMGKMFNAAQTCIAPDYLLVPTGWDKKIEEEFNRCVASYFPNLMKNNDYSNIISTHHKERLLAMLEDAKAKGARIVTFGEQDNRSNKMPLYLLFNVTKDMAVMQEEIFGPLLPVVEYKTIKEAISFVNELPNPLALYYFGEDKEEQELLLTDTLSGAFTVNETLMHIAVDDLPFGGVGNSGMGHYHGKEGFDTFSKLKPVFIQSKFATVSWLYPPYGRFLKLVLSWIGGIKLGKQK